MTRSVQIASFRRLTPAIVASTHLAMAKDVPDANKNEIALLLKRAAPVLGIDGTTYHVLDILIGLSRPDDWKGIARPIVAISNAKLSEYTMRSERTVMRCIRKLVELGIAAYRDSSNGRRFVQRSENGKIACGYGIDFTPARVRAAELHDMVDEYQRRLKRELSAKRDVARLTRAMADLRAAFPEHDGKLLSIIQPIFASQCEITDHARRLQAAYEEAVALVSPISSQEMTARGDIDDIPYITTNLESNSNSNSDTGNQAAARASEPSDGIERSSPRATTNVEVLSNVPLDLLRTGCRLAQDMTGIVFDSWSTLQRSGETLRRMIGLSEKLWTDAVSKVGAHAASAIVATVVEKSLRKSDAIAKPDGYFHAMISRAGHGLLRLDRTLFGLSHASISLETNQA